MRNLWFHFFGCGLPRWVSLWLKSGGEFGEAGLTFPINDCKISTSIEVENIKK
jgi:hypothetical protein